MSSIRLTLTRRNRLVALFVLILVWTLLWGSFTVANILSGIIVSVVIMAVLPLPPVAFGGRLRPWGAVIFLSRFFFDLVKASIEVAWLAFRIGHQPSGAIAAVTLRVRTALNLTLIAEAVSLIPGSLIVEADMETGTLYIHIIGTETEEDVWRFKENVLALEKRLVKAMGSADELKRLDQPVPSDRIRAATEGTPT